MAYKEFLKLATLQKNSGKLLNQDLTSLWPANLFLLCLASTLLVGPSVDSSSCLTPSQLLNPKIVEFKIFEPRNC